MVVGLEFYDCDTNDALYVPGLLRPDENAKN